MKTSVVTDAQRTSWERDGFFRIEGFADQATCDAMLDELVSICRRRAAGDHIGHAWVMPEPQELGPRANPEELVAKVFRLHRDYEVFNQFPLRPGVVDFLTRVLALLLSAIAVQLVVDAVRALSAHT